MSLHIYIGPMFAGKSTTILGILRRNRVIHRNTLCITSTKDTRAPNTITSHNQDSYPAIAADSLHSIFTTLQFAECSELIIEESQFFPDLKYAVLEAVEVHKKHVTVFGLDGDFARKPFGQILDLIPYCDTVQKLTALCTHCADGTPALFSSRTSQHTSQVLVGAQDVYEPLCRKHFLLKN